MPCFDVEEFLCEYYPYSDNTKIQYRIILHRFADTGPEPAQMMAVDFRAWLDSLENWGGSMRWLAYSAVKSYLRWKFDNDHPALKLKYKRSATPPQRTLTAQRALTLWESFDTDTVKGIRDLAIYAVLVDTGIRERELCALELEHLYLDRLLLTVEIKGGGWEYGVYCDLTAQYLRNWLALRDEIAKPNVPQVFVGIGGRKPGTRTTPGGLRATVRKWGIQAEIGKLSPHDFRRTFATLATLAKAPTRTTQLAGRWKRIEEVERYTRALRLDAFRAHSPIKYLHGLSTSSEH